MVLMSKDWLIGQNKTARNLHQLENGAFKRIEKPSMMEIVIILSENYGGVRN